LRNKRTAGSNYWRNFKPRQPPVPVSSGTSTQWTPVLWNTGFWFLIFLFLIFLIFQKKNWENEGSIHTHTHKKNGVSVMFHPPGRCLYTLVITGGHVELPHL
jgi:hypothetical protein